MNKKPSEPPYSLEIWAEQFSVAQVNASGIVSA